MIILEFQNWLSTTPEELYGIPKVLPPKQSHYEEEPLETLNSIKVLDELERLGKIGTKIPYRSFPNIIEYGDKAGKIEIVNSPFGSFKYILRRYGSDLKGNPVPFCKKVYPLVNDYDHFENFNDEESIAHYFYEKIKNIDLENLDSCKKINEKEFEDFVITLAQSIRNNHPKIMFFDEVIRRNPNNFIISYNFRGGGFGAPNQKRALKFIVNVQYVPDLGVIRCWGNDVLTNYRSKSMAFEQQPSEWDELFSPMQQNECIENIIKIFSTY